MAMKESLMVKTVENAAIASLQPQVGESYKVTKVMVSAGSATHAYFYIDKTTVGYFRLSGTQGNDLSEPSADGVVKNSLSVLGDLSIFRPYPVSSGETFSVKADSGTFGRVVIVYQVYDEADVKNTDPNGSAASEYDAIIYGRPGAITPDQYSQYKVCTSPDEFPKFPFEEVVPAKTTITLHGLEFSAVGKTANSAADKAITKYLKFQRDRIVLFDDEKNGLVYIGSAPTADGMFTSAGQLIDISKTGNDPSICLFEKPLAFAEGEDLDLYIYVSNVAGSGTLDPTDVELGLITTVKAS